MTYVRSFLSCLLLTALIAGLPTRGDAQIPAQAYAIIDNTTGQVLESYNGQRKAQVGSLTKIATAMVVLDWSEAHNGDLNQRIVVPESAQSTGGADGVGFHPGDECSMRDLLYAALMQSDNQAAETLAAHVGAELGAPHEPVTTFVAQMNALARHLGMKNTRFVNPHGLEGQDRMRPYSTAEDMAKLTRYAMERASFRFYVSQKERKITTYSAAGETSGYLLRNTNELLGTDSIDGVKTGTTHNAGPCLIISAAKPPESVQQGDVHIVTPRRIDVVVLASTDRFGVAHSLLSKGWRLFEEWAAAGRPAKWSHRS
jgi:D-alanyl-D-alanine carboxypeptidase (penicillin-binding protein 5/6)